MTIPSAKTAVGVAVGLDGSIWLAQKYNAKPKGKKAPAYTLALYCYSTTAFVSTQAPAYAVSALYSVSAWVTDSVGAVYTVGIPVLTNTLNSVLSGLITKAISSMLG